MSRKDFDALGSQRESLSKNPLLIQAEVGKVRKRCMTLPPSNYTYGAPTVYRDGGVPQALSSWKTHKMTWKYVAPPGKDFIALNRSAVVSGLTTSQEQQHYRATHDIRRRLKTREERPKMMFPDDMVFGVTTRPSTPIYELLENKYQDKWIKERREAERSMQEEEEKRRLRGKVYETRATLLRRYSEPVDPLPYWKMKRWNKIPPQLGSFRTDKARSEAFHHHASDAISRTGVFGHGIYEAAKT